MIKTKKQQSEGSKLSYTVSFKYRFLFQELIRRRPLSERLKLKNMQYCGFNGLAGRVVLSRREIVAKDTGEILEQSGHAVTAHCNNSWCCPVCAVKNAKKMQQKVERMLIGVSEIGYGALMVTLSVPHNKMTTAEDALKNVREAWALVMKTPKFRHFRKKLDLIGQFSSYETTWGPQWGWHVHCHTLMIVPKDIEPKLITDYVAMVRDRLNKHYKMKYKVSDESLEKHKSFYLSTNKDGSFSWYTNGDYIAAALSVELTYGSKKSVAEGHYQLFDLLYSDKPELQEEFVRFAIATQSLQGHVFRFYATKGLWQYMCSDQHYKEYLKKKYPQEMRTVTISETVGFFTSEEWREITEAEILHHHPYVFEILDIIKDKPFAELVLFCRRCLLPEPHEWRQVLRYDYRAA